MAVGAPLFDPTTGAATPPAGIAVPPGFKFAGLTPSGRGAGLPEFFDPAGRLVTETAPGTLVPTARFQGFPEAGGFFQFAKGFAGFLGSLAPFIVGIPALAGVPLGGAAGAAAAAGGGSAGGGIPAISATEFGEAGDLGSIGLAPTAGAASVLNPEDFFQAAVEGAPATLETAAAPEIAFSPAVEAGLPLPIGAGAVAGAEAGAQATLGGGGGGVLSGFSVAKALKLLPLAAGVISLQGHTGNSDLFTSPTTGQNPSGGAGGLQDPLAGLASGLANLLGGGPGGGDGGGGGGGEANQRGLTFLPTQGKQTGFLLLAVLALAAGGVWFALKHRKGP